MTIPNTIRVRNRKYIFVKEYENYIRYKEAEAGYMVCFTKHELGLVKEIIKPAAQEGRIGTRKL